MLAHIQEEGILEVVGSCRVGSRVDWERFFGDWKAEQDPTLMWTGSSVVVGYPETWIESLD